MSQWFCDQLKVDEHTTPLLLKSCVFSAGLSDQDITLLKTIIKKFPEDDGMIEVGDKIEYARISTIAWINYKDSELAWLIDRLEAMVYHANKTMRWNFQLDGFHEEFQYARYDGAVGGHFEIHTDLGEQPITSSRKLSISIQLSDASDYEGGELEIYGSGIVPKQKGAVVIFPSFLMHQVRPVTKGTRESLIAWVCGLPYR